MKKEDRIHPVPNQLFNKAVSMVRIARNLPSKTIVRDTQLQRIDIKFIIYAKVHMHNGKENYYSRLETAKEP